jgi:hypothetical protein
MQPEMCLPLWKKIAQGFDMGEPADGNALSRGNAQS